MRKMLEPPLLDGEALEKICAGYWDAYPVPIAAQSESQMVSHAQQLPKEDAAVSGVHAMLLDQSHCLLNGHLVVGGDHHLSSFILDCGYQVLDNSASEAT